MQSTLDTVVTACMPTIAVHTTIPCVPGNFVKNVLVILAKSLAFQYIIGSCPVSYCTVQVPGRELRGKDSTSFSVRMSIW